jgi:hypothetical protein
MGLVEAVWSGWNFTQWACRGGERGNSKIIVFVSAGLGQGDVVHDRSN